MLEYLNPKFSFEQQLNNINGFSLLRKNNSITIEMGGDLNENHFESLLILLRKYLVSFSIIDYLYPNKTTQNALFVYSQVKNESENTWSLEIQNQGYSGGIYSIFNQNLKSQISNLFNKRLINSIRINNAKIFAELDLENIDKNRNINALLFGIHNETKKIEVNNLTFGIFSSDNYNPYHIYQIKNNELFVDKSGIWNSTRHSKSNYIFKGEKISNEKFEIAKELICKIPIELLIQKWNGFYTTGNKNEDQLILEFSNSNFHKTISINSYEIETNDLPENIKNYRIEVEDIIKKLNN